MTPRGSEAGAGTRRLYESRQLRAIAARWDAKAATWERQLGNPACHLNEDEGYARFLTEIFAILDQRRQFCRRHGVIDAGCGTGLVLAAVLPSFRWGLGVDISPEMIRIARGKPLPGAKFVVGDCFALSSFNGPAGAVLSRGVLLSHYGRAAAGELLQAARKALVPAGFLFCDFLNQAARDTNIHAPGNKTYFAGPDLRALALDAGFAKARLLGKPGGRARFLLAELR